ncbi:hypothetical protein [Microcystis sp. LE19-195.1E]|uniref:hypothetical protein n=1 Tax=Microcystis sp. LE19-195.1E TaxID=3016440 RepID=UPI00258A8B7E|nr:hypothetical protein [Microcystis sp. LE19-195.1E]
MIFATFWIFFVIFATFFQKINYFSGICLSFLAIRSQETGGRSRETGGRRQEIISIYSSDTPHPTPHTPHPTPHTPHPTPHTLPPPKSFLPQTQLSIRIWPKQPDSKQRKTNGRYRF